MYHFFPEYNKPSLGANSDFFELWDNDSKNPVLLEVDNGSCVDLSDYNPTVKQAVNRIYLNPENFEFEELEKYTNLSKNDILSPESLVIAFNEAIKDKKFIALERDTCTKAFNKIPKLNTKNSFIKNALVGAAISIIISKILK